MFWLYSVLGCVNSFIFMLKKGVIMLFTFNEIKDILVGLVAIIALPLTLLFLLIIISYRSAIFILEREF